MSANVRGPLRPSVVREPFRAPLTVKALLALATAVAFAAWLSLRWASGTDGLPAIWLGNGLVVGALLPRGKQDWPLVVAAAALSEFAVRALLGDALGPASIMVMASALEISVVAVGVRHWIDDPVATDRVIELALAATGSTIAACAISAILPAAFLDAGRVHGFAVAWAVWFSVHVVGIVMTASLVTVAGRLGLRLWGRPTRRIDYALCHIVLLAACSVVFLQARAPLLFLVFPPLVLLTFRHGFAGSITGIIVVATLGTLAALTGSGPFALLGSTSTQSQILLAQLFIAAACLISMPIATVMAARRRLARLLQRSEEDYRLLAENTRDLVVRIGADGTYPYVSRSVTQLLGWDREAFTVHGARLLHPDDVEATLGEFKHLIDHGGSRTLLFRMRHADGHYIWIETVAARAEHAAVGTPVELVASGRDVSVRVATQTALDESQRRLQAITNTLPALVSYVDRDERYTFVNAHYERLLGIPPSALLGRTLLESRGDEARAQWGPYVRRALAGEVQVFDVEPSNATGGRYLQSHYIPDMAADGSIPGFYAFTFDISELKIAEKALTRLTRVDPLTGLGNRRMLEEHLDAAIMRARRRRKPLVLVYLDLDHFKQINDTLGHLAGDAVLRAFADRIRHCVYEVDVVARLGGDEFVIVVEDAPDVNATQVMARKILAAMQAPMSVLDQTVQVSTSIGIAFCARPLSNDQVLALADRALYAAKAAGRKQFHIAIQSGPDEPLCSDQPHEAGAGLPGIGEN